MISHLPFRARYFETILQIPHVPFCWELYSFLEAGNGCPVPQVLPTENSATAQWVLGHLISVPWGLLAISRHFWVMKSPKEEV